MSKLTVASKGVSAFPFLLYVFTYGPPKCEEKKQKLIRMESQINNNLTWQKKLGRGLIKEWYWIKDWSNNYSYIHKELISSLKPVLTLEYHVTIDEHRYTDQRHETILNLDAWF